MTIPELYGFSRMPSPGQIQIALDEAYRTGRNDCLRRLLRAYAFFFEDAEALNQDPFNAFALEIAAGLPAQSVTVFCGSCGFVDSSAQRECGRCRSPTTALSSFDIGELAWQGLSFHVPSELYCAASLESAGYHLVRVDTEERESVISITFNAFGSKVDVDALGVGHPPCLVFVAATTSRVTQGKAMAIQGPISLLQKMMRDRFPDMPPFQTVVVALGNVDDNLDLVGLERSGVTIYRPDQVTVLAKELAKVPPRLTMR